MQEAFVENGRSEIVIGHSPDADDMAMFWPLIGMRGPDGEAVAGADGLPRVKGATGRFSYTTLAADIGALNTRAVERGDLDVTAISAFTYPFVRERYGITGFGGSFGEGFGPKVVVARDSGIMCDGCLRAHDPLIAVPGMRTTAFLLLSMVVGGGGAGGPRVIEMPFQEIAGAVARGEVGAGVLIHEAQLSFEELGLRAVVDLGAWWMRRTGLPLPLGLNVVRRDLDERYGAGATGEIVGALAASVRFAAEHRADTKRFLRMHAGSRPEWNDDALLDRYLDMYVSPMTVDMGERGREALGRLFAEAHERGMCPEAGEVEVVGQG